MLINSRFTTRQSPRKLTGCLITAAQQYCYTDRTHSVAGIIRTPINRTCIQNEPPWVNMSAAFLFLAPEQAKQTETETLKDCRWSSSCLKRETKSCRKLIRYNHLEQRFTRVKVLFSSSISSSHSNCGTEKWNEFTMTSRLTEWLCIKTRYICIYIYLMYVWKSAVHIHTCMY